MSSKKCDQVLAAIPDYLTGDLDDTRKKTIQTHTATCDTCRKELEEISATWSIVAWFSTGETEQ